MWKSLSLWACLPSSHRGTLVNTAGNCKNSTQACEVGAGEAINGIWVASVAETLCCILSVCSKQCCPVLREIIVQLKLCFWPRAGLHSVYPYYRELDRVCEVRGGWLWSDANHCDFWSASSIPVLTDSTPLGPLSPAQPTHSAYPVRALSLQAWGEPRWRGRDETSVASRTKNVRASVSTARSTCNDTK